MIELWNTVLLNPIVNSLIIISDIFGNSFGFSIVVLTIIINILILPLTLRQIRSTKSMQSLQPKLQDMQKKFKKDKQKIQQETMRIYKESGVNPVGCIFPLLIQMPIIIALYQGILQALATTPERLLELSSRLYSWSIVQGGIPPESKFIGLNLEAPNFILVIFIIATMWVTQKMSTTPSTDPRQQQMSSMMQWMMPLMFGFIFLNFPSGLALYIVVGNIFRMVLQYKITGNWGGLANMFQARVATNTPGQSSGGWTKPGKAGWTPPNKTNKEIEAAIKKTRITTTPEEGGINDGTARNKRKDRRRGRRTGPE